MNTEFFTALELLEKEKGIPALRAMDDLELTV